MKNRSVLLLQNSGKKASTKSYYLHFGLICSNSSTLSFDLGKGEEGGGGWEENTPIVMSSNTRQMLVRGCNGGQAERFQND